MDEKQFHIPPIYMQPPYPLNDTSSTPPSAPQTSPLTSIPLSPNFPQGQQMHQGQTNPNSNKLHMNPKFKKVLCWVIIISFVFLLIVGLVLYLKYKKGKLFQGKNKKSKGAKSARSSKNLDVREWVAQSNGNQYQEYQQETIKDRGLRAEREADREGARMARSATDDRLRSDDESEVPNLREKFLDAQYRRQAESLIPENTQMAQSDDRLPPMISIPSSQPLNPGGGSGGGGGGGPPIMSSSDPNGTSID